MKTKIICSAFALLLSLILPFGLTAQSFNSIAEPGRGYWQVHTDHQSLNTVVQFFDKSHRLVYSETLQKQYVKLNKRNIRRFDALLQKLETNELLNGNIRTYELVADSRTVFRDVSVPAEASSSNHQTDETNVYVLKDGKLKIIVTNPLHESYDISIIDDELRSIYQEAFAEPKYGRWFDMSRLKEGAYKIRIKGPRKRLNYKMEVDGYLGYHLTPLK